MPSPEELTRWRIDLENPDSWSASVRCAAVSILICGLSGCVQYAPFKPGASSVVTDPSYKLAFVEFGEQGSYREPGQLERALDLIRRTRKPLVITYVHGWQNNAGSGDVDSFSSFLREL